MLYQLSPEDKRLLVEEIKVNISQIKKKNIQKKWSNIVVEHLQLLKTSYQVQNPQIQQAYPNFNNNFNKTHSNTHYTKNQAKVNDSTISYSSKLNDSSFATYSSSYGTQNYIPQYTSTSYESRYGDVPMTNVYQPFYPSNYIYPKNWSHKEGAI